MDHLRVTLCLCSCLCFKTSSRDKHEFDLLENRHVCKQNTFSYEWFRKKTLFDTEAKEMKKCLILNGNERARRNGFVSKQW